MRMNKHAVKYFYFQRESGFKAFRVNVSQNAMVN